MTDKIEIQGKTVDEAVSEALLRMGARRDEVDVTVLEEPKTGFLGLLGNRPARVIVRRRHAAGRGRKGEFLRNDADHQPHDLSGSENRGGRGRGRSGRASERAATTEASRGGRGRGGDSRRGGRSGGRDDARRDEGRDSRPDRRGGRRGAAATDGQDEVKVEASGQVGTNGRVGAAAEGEDRGTSRRRRGRRGGRGRSGGGREQRPAPDAAVERERETEGAGNVRASAGNGDIREDADRMEAERSGRDDRNRRGRSRDGRGGRRRDERPAAAEADSRSAPVADNAHVAAERDSGPAPTRPASALVDQPIAAGIKALSYAQPQTPANADNLDAELTNLASGMLVRAGFPCRCEVKPGEYRLVKIVTDDTSAGMLIGRHGQTIDAVEHLVERMISTAAGDRVRMNLDINNYRRRRQDALVERVAQAVAQVQASGSDCHLEPMDARERRICHLEAALTDGLRTWTVNGPGGKHVVIGIDDGTVREDEEDSFEMDEDGQEPDTGAEARAETDGPDSTETVLLEADALDLPAEEDEPERPGADS